MQTFVTIWIIVASLLALYIGCRWTKVGFLDLSIKMTWFALVIGGAIILYHRLVLNLPI